MFIKSWVENLLPLFSFDDSEHDVSVFLHIFDNMWKMFENIEYILNNIPHYLYRLSNLARFFLVMDWFLKTIQTYLYFTHLYFHRKRVWV